jgi:hypothetical protein
VGLIVRELETVRGLIEPYMPRWVIVGVAAINVMCGMQPKPVKLVCTSNSVEGSVISADEMVQTPKSLKTPVTDSLEREVIVMVVVKRDGTSNDQLNVDRPSGLPAGKFALNV